MTPWPKILAGVLVVAALGMVGFFGLKVYNSPRVLIWRLQHVTSVAEGRRVKGMLVDLGPAAVPALIEALGDEDAGVRRHAASLLGKIGPGAEAAVPALIAALKDEDGEVRLGAMWPWG